MDDVPLYSSPTASVGALQRSLTCDDIQNPREGGAKANHPFGQRHSIHGMCAVPIWFRTLPHFTPTSSSWLNLVKLMVWRNHSDTDSVRLFQERQRAR